jgi:nicotinate phosphoribosyltransferase
MAHSYIQAHVDEREAFRAFARAFPGAVLLVDTYDTLQGVRRAIELIRDPSARLRIAGVRLDSGDLGSLAREARRLLDSAGLTDLEIFASSDLDEHAIAALVGAAVPINGFGIGSDMGVSSDAPSLDVVYKLVEYAGKGRTKLSAHKPILPGRKQVFRQESGGRATGDVIAACDETLEGRPLLQLVMTGGRRTSAGEVDLGAARRRRAIEIDTLPRRILALQPADLPYPVNVSAALRARHAAVQDSAVSA